jgi:3-deoxy-D-manno-octulosonic acid (KDO) 8-phosphate synthase
MSNRSSTYGSSVIPDNLKDALSVYTEYRNCVSLLHITSLHIVKSCRWHIIQVIPVPQIQLYALRVVRKLPTTTTVVADQEQKHKHKFIETHTQHTHSQSDAANMDTEAEADNKPIDSQTGEYYIPCTPHQHVDPDVYVDMCV